MKCVEIACDRGKGITERIDAIILAGQKKEQGARDALRMIIHNEKDALEARVHAVRALCNLDKHEAYPVLLETLDNPNQEIRMEAITSSYFLGDSRILFPLVNLYNRLDPEKEEDLLARYAIIRALGASAVC